MSGIYKNLRSLVPSILSERAASCDVSLPAPA